MVLKGDGEDEDEDELLLRLEFWLEVLDVLLGVVLRDDASLDAIACVRAVTSLLSIFWSNLDCPITSLKSDGLFSKSCSVAELKSLGCSGDPSIENVSACPSG